MRILEVKSLKIIYSIELLTATVYCGRRLWHYGAAWVGLGWILVSRIQPSLGWGFLSLVRFF